MSNWAEVQSMPVRLRSILNFLGPSVLYRSVQSKILGCRHRVHPSMHKAPHLPLLAPATGSVIVIIILIF